MTEHTSGAPEHPLERRLYLHPEVMRYAKQQRQAAVGDGQVVVDRVDVVGDAERVPCWRSECRRGCYYPRGCTQPLAATRPDETRGQS